MVSTCNYFLLPSHTYLEYPRKLIVGAKSKEQGRPRCLSTDAQSHRVCYITVVSAAIKWFEKSLWERSPPKRYLIRSNEMISTLLIATR